jgi:germination protein YpeB
MAIMFSANNNGGALMKNYYYESAAKNQKSGIVRIWLIIMTAAFIAAVIWGFWQNSQKRHFNAMLENQYQQIFYALAENASRIYLNSGKIPASGGRQSQETLKSMAQDAEEITLCLSKLPLEQTSLLKTGRYFNQLGEYFSILAKGLRDGAKLESAELAALKKIGGDMEHINEILSGAREKTLNGEIRFAAEKSPLLKGIIPTAANSENIFPASIMTYLEEIDAKITAMDEIVYQGLYSASSRNKIPKGLAHEKEAAAADLEKNAAAFASLMTEEELTENDIREIGAESSLPAREFSYKHKDGIITITLSERGGKILSAYNSRPLKKERLSVEIGSQKGAAFLDAAGFKEMELTERQKEGDVLRLKYVGSRENILYYPDSVNIFVALDRGEIILFQAVEYWLNYDKMRELPQNLTDAQILRASLSPALEGGESRLALIDDGAGGEVLCYEYGGKIGDDEYLIYLGAEKGREERVLRKYADEKGFYAR